MANDGAAGNFSSANFPAGVSSVLASGGPEPAAAPAPASTPASNGASGGNRGGQPAAPAPGQGASDIERMFGQVDDVAADDGGEGATQQPDQQAQQQSQQQDDDFINAEPVDPMDKPIHGVKTRDLLAAIESGSLPAEILEKLTNVSVPALDDVYFADEATGFQGMKGSEVLAALKSGEPIPNELLRKIPVRVKVDGRELIVDAREAGDGYQRLSDTSRKNKEIANRARQLDERDATFQEMINTWAKDPAAARIGAKGFKFYDSIEKGIFEGWNDPGTLRKMLVRRGFGKQLEAVHMKMMEENLELHDMGFFPDGTPNPAGKALAQRYREQREREEALDRDGWIRDQQVRDAQELARLRQQRAQQQQQQQPRAQNPADVESIKLIGDAMPEAFKIVGVKGSRYAENVFSSEAAALIEAHRGDFDNAALSRIVLQAAQATKEILGDEAAGVVRGAQQPNGGGRGPLMLRPPPANGNGQQPAAQASPAQQQVATAAAQQAQRAAQPNPSPLSPRPGAVPTAPAGAGANPYGTEHSSEGFQAHIANLRRMSRGR